MTKLEELPTNSIHPPTSDAPSPSKALREKLLTDRLKDSGEDFTHFMAVMTPDGREFKKLVEFDEVVNMVNRETSAALDRLAAKLQTYRSRSINSSQASLLDALADDIAAER